MQGATPPCWDELVGAKSGFGAMGRGKQGGLWRVEGGQAFTEETKAKEIPFESMDSGET